LLPYSRYRTETHLRAVQMYAWTYDLLHIAIYPHNDQASAEAFLLALRAKSLP